MNGERGSILAQVLITTAIASLLCASILRARLQPALTTAGAVDRIRDDLAEQAAVNRVTEVWTRLGVCKSDGEAGVRCRGAGCDCSCDLDPAQPYTAGATVASAAAGGACRLTASPQ
ncbi:MAG: hypothetical protein KGL74_01420 [Elusimicrobia bacterium]|nr:hypothetical protein [Elusimicrobiota bacterium]